MIPRGFLALFLTSFVLTAGYGSIYTLLAAIRAEFGFSAAEIGVIGAAGFLAGFAAQVGLSRYADRGYTPSMLRLGLFCAVLGNAGMVNRRRPARVRGLPCAALRARVLHHARRIRGYLGGAPR